MSGGLTNANRLGVDDDNLRLRREFIGLGDDERALLEPLVPWVRQRSATLARRFYDHQFGFAPAERFFANHAQSTGVGLGNLRQALESAQAGYIEGVFAGATSTWDLDYFELRLHVGLVHDRIDLPFKWYVGSYAKWRELVREALVDDFLPRHGDPKAAGWRGEHGPPKTLEEIEAIMRAVDKVFNLDLQAISDAFLTATLESLGLSVLAIRPEPGQDRTEGIAQIKADIETLMAQAECLSADVMDTRILDRQIDGSIGNSFSTVSAKIQRVARAIADVSGNVSSVAASVEELSVSSQEISARSSEVVSMSDRAVELADVASEAVRQLTESSDRIDRVTGAIAKVADQTNLLALNATIEAARAGEAGKGFAVVANEVKDLARQTATSTADIETQIAGIRDQVSGAVHSIAAIVESINSVNNAQSSIAAAIEEQSAAVGEVGKNIIAASSAAGEIQALVQLAD
jgi:methyl-accepting chemotaxis protein